MLVHEQYRKCVAFLCLPHPTVTWQPVGSAFFVAVPVNENAGVLYVVTAKHVVEGAGPLRPLHLRLNVRGQEASEYIQIDHDDWYLSSETDIAVVPISVSPTTSIDIQWIRPSQIAGRDVLEAQRVGPGDEVFFSGLFTSISGLKRAEPVIRFGTISMMPSEPIPVSNAHGGKNYVEAFLVEARSWAGQSGSPAFVYFPATRHPGFLEWSTIVEDANGEQLVPDKVMPQLLGIVVGHFNLDADVAFSEDNEITSTVLVNSGIAVVVPAQKIWDTLMEEELVNERMKDVHSRGDGDTVATPDSVSSERVSLSPLDPEAALRGLLATPPESDRPDS